MTSFSPLFGFWEGVQLDPAIANAWGTPNSLNYTLVENAIAGVAQVNIAGQTTFTITKNIGAVDNWKAATIQFTGALVTPCTVTIPNVPRGVGLVQNSTTGGFNIVLTTGAGTTVTIPPDGARYSYSIDASGNVTLPTSGFGSIATAGSMKVGTTFTAAGASTFNAAATFNSPALFQQAATFAGLLAISNANMTLNGGTLTITGQAATTVTDAGAFGPTGASTGNTGPVNYSISTSGAMISAGFYAISDARVKRVVETISPTAAWDWILAARPVTYWLDLQWGAGFIAQEDMKSDRGRAVAIVPDDDPRFADTGHRLTRNYNHDIAYLTAALQDALARIEKLEADAI